MMIPAPERRITLTTDFGTCDGYAGAMKGVIRRVSPEAVIEDITHEIPAGDIRAGAWALRTAFAFFPRGTVHVGVIDPGVGTARRALVAAVDGQFLIGPDNGLFSWLFAEAEHLRAWRLSDRSWRPARASNTFHGRDLFAHAAALMVQEGDVAAVCGGEIQPLVEDWARWHRLPHETEGEIVHIDHFGNVVTNLMLPEDWNPDQISVEIPRVTHPLLRLHRTYGDVEEGGILTLVGSHSFLEIAVRQGSAATRLGLKRGDTVRVRLSTP